MKVTITTTLILFALLVSAQNRPIHGKGPITQKYYTLTQFHKINVNHSANVTIDCGTMPQVSIKTKENIHSLLKVNVADMTLNISSQGWIESGGTQIKINTPFISEYTCSGSGNSAINNLKTKNFTISTSSGNLKVTGEVTNMTINGSGSGNINLSKLKTKTIHISKSGANNISLNVSDTLFVTKMAGSISYIGSPVIIAADGIDTTYIMKSEEKAKAKRELRYVKITLKNNTNSKKDFYIKGPKGHPFSYGFPMRGNTKRVENAPVGTRIWQVNKLGIPTKLVYTLILEDKGKTINLFP